MKNKPKKIKSDYEKLVNQTFLSRLMKENPICQHAMMELSKLNIKEDIGSSYLQYNLLNLLAIFGVQNHKEYRTDELLHLFNKLIRFGVLSPIYDVEEEWIKLEDCYQNIRDPRLIKKLIKEENKFIYNNAFNCNIITTKPLDSPRIEKNKGLFVGFPIVLDNEGKSTGSRLVGAAVRSMPFMPRTFNLACLEVEKTEEKFELYIFNSMLEELNQIYELQFEQVDDDFDYNKMLLEEEQYNKLNEHVL